MDVITKSATVAPVESDHPNGQFEVILSTETRDRDDENLWADEWKQPLPERIHIDGDHGRSLEKTVDSAVPRLEGNKLIGKGTYAGTPYAQMVRQLVNEGHINSVSVTYTERKAKKDSRPERELLNAAFVAIPANPEAKVLASKSAKPNPTPDALNLIELLNDKAGEGAFGASGNDPDVKHDQMVQAMHDAACHLGAMCRNEIDADPGSADGANKAADVALKEKSSSPEAGSPQESHDDSPADAATEAAAPAPAEVPADAADESVDDVAKQALALKARALQFLMSKTTFKE